MIVLDCPQGGDEWVTARLGIATASQFHRILTKKTMKPSAQAKGYLHELLAEWAIGFPLDDAASGFMERGTALEDAAADFYEFQSDVNTTKVGLVLSDDRRVGCSPDRLVGDDGGLEIKCPSAKVHVSYILGTPVDDYRAQVQGALWLTDRKWWDVLSYHPELPPALVRVERDDAFILALSSTVADFLDRLDDAKVSMKGKGVLHV